MKHLTVFALLTIGACSTSTGVLPFGKDTFTVAVSSEGGSALAKRNALTEANAFCAEKGLVMMPVSQESGQQFAPGFASDIQGNYDLIFRCLSETDADYQRTTPDRPDIVIKNQ